MGKLKLNQVIAIEKGVKSKTHSDLSSIHHKLNKPEPLSGISRTYTAKDDQGEVLPAEVGFVQIKINDVIKDVVGFQTRLFDVIATKDWGNTLAKADLKIGDTVLLKDVPVTYLLFLAKKLDDMHTFIKDLPTLDQRDRWSFDETSDTYATETVETTKTKKVFRNHVKAEATKEHPAQVDVYAEDEVVGYWKTVKFSGALPVARVNELLNRVLQLQEAVKIATEEANMISVDDQSAGKPIFDYLFA